MKALVIGACWLGLSACVTPPGNAPSPDGPAVRAVTVDPASESFDKYLNRAPLLPGYRRVELDNGAVLLLLVKPEVPMVGFEAIIRGGASADPAGRNGTASLLAELLRKGAGERDSETFAATVEGIGGQLDTGAGVENLRVSGDFLSRDAALGVSLLADLLMRPRLDEQEFDKLRARAIQFIKAAKDGSPNQLLPIYAAAAIYGDHPYGRASTGDETSLAQLQIDDLRRFYRDQVGGDRLILTVAGDFDPEKMIAMIRDAFGDWRRAAAPLPDYGTPQRAPGGRVVLIDKPDATQTYFWIGNVGVSRYYPQRAELALANTIFGGRFTSMLNTALRIESGLTYGASSRLTQPQRAGSVGIVSFTATETTARAIDLALQTLAQLHSDGPDEASLNTVKTYLLGQFPLAFETARQLARQAAQLEFFGLDNDWVNAYAQQIVDANKTAIDSVIAEVYPQPDELVFVMIGNADAIRDQVSAYGEVTEIGINAPQFRLD